MGDRKLVCGGVELVCGRVQLWLVSGFFVKDSCSFALATSMRVQRDGYHIGESPFYCHNKCYDGQHHRLMGLVYR